MTRFFLYTIKWDTGLAPNPYGHRATLAVCKPRIRRAAQINDIVIAIQSKTLPPSDGTFQVRDISRPGRVVFVGIVSNIISHREYAIKNWKRKIPSDKRPSGDNLYTKHGKFRRTTKIHKKIGERERDLSGPVLIFKNFSYFGSTGIFPPRFISERLDRAPRAIHTFQDDDMKHWVKRVLKKYPRRQGSPRLRLLR